jgi:DNA helicase-2/ATP-dependent DNA helicase PcrA
VWAVSWHSKHLNQIKQKYGTTPENYQKDDSFSQNITPSANDELSIGRTVKHAKFGFGTVLNFEGNGESKKWRFDNDPYLCKGLY